MDNSEIVQKKSLRHFIFWVVSNPFLFVSFRIDLDSLSSCQDNWKTVFPCSKILYLCLESLGLDITSVNFNHFKMTATCPFLWFLYIKKSYQRLIPAWYTFDKKSFTNSNKFSLFYLKLAWIGSFRFLLDQNILTKLFQLINWY